MRDSFRFAAVIYVAVLAVSGCMAPVGGSKSSAKNGARTGSKGRSGLSAHVPPSKPANAASLDRVRVGTESLQATELWAGMGDELAARANAATVGEFEQFVEQRAAQLIADKVAEMLLYQKASARLTDQAEKGIERFVDSEIRKTVTEDFSGVQRRYEKHLEARGTTLEETREKMRREIVIAGFLEAEIKPKIGEPTRAELRAAFDAERDSMRRKERRRMSLITVRILDELPKDVVEPTRYELQAARERARAKILAVRDELSSGSDFADLARRYSSDLHAADGGAWDWVSVGIVRERFEPAVSALHSLAPGRVSDVVETPDDFFLVRCDEVDAGMEPTFELVQSEIKERFVRSAYNKLIRELIVDLRARAHLEVEDLERFHAAAVANALHRGEGTRLAAPPNASVVVP